MSCNLNHSPTLYLLWMSGEPTGRGKTPQWTQAFRSQRHWFLWQLGNSTHKLRTLCPADSWSTEPNTLGPNGRGTESEDHFACSFMQQIVTVCQLCARHCTGHGELLTVTCAGRTLRRPSVPVPTCQHPWVRAGMPAPVTATAKSLSEARERQVGGCGQGAGHCG